jgi:hypothetical protein
MPKFAVYGVATASKFLGEYEAETQDEAIEMARVEGDYSFHTCHQCARHVDIGDIYEEQAEEIPE